MNGREVQIIEVSPRDGIQNEPKVLPTAVKLMLIEKARGAGINRMEATSFVNPKRVPQMFDSDEIGARVARDPAYGAIALVLNRRGFDRAVAAGFREVNLVVVASETFSQKNQGMSTEDSLALIEAIADEARPAVKVGVTIGAAFGCPFEGEVPADRILLIADRCLPHADEVALADTIGVGTPTDVAARVGALVQRSEVPVRLHLHNTRGTGLANAWAGIEAGARALDASLGGTGGCPFAPNATGNIATEDLVYMLDRAGVSTGVDLDAAIEAACWLEGELGIRAPGHVMRAGSFPRPMAA